jgi:hypothetical protein
LKNNKKILLEHNALLKEFKGFLVENQFYDDFLISEQILNEGKATEVIVAAALLSTIALVGYSGKEMSNYVSNKFKDKLTSSQIKKIETDIEDYKKVSAEEQLVALSKEIDDQKNNKVIDILNKSKRLASKYQQVQGNSFLKSVFVSELFHSSPGLKRTISSHSRTAKINNKQRWILFYTQVVNKTPKDITKGLDKEEKKECIKHNKWSLYSKMITNIKSNSSGAPFFLLEASLASYIKNNSDINIKVLGENKTSWCTATLGYLVSDFLAFEKKDLEEGKISGSVFGSTQKMYNNFKNSEDLVYSHEKATSSSLTQDQKLENIRSVIKVGSLITLKGISKKVFGGHGAFVIKVNSDNTIDTVEGNTGDRSADGRIAVKTRKFEEIRMIINLKEMFGPAPSAVKITTLPSIDFKLEKVEDLQKD